MKQIVEETKANGKKQYRVLTDRCFFGLFHCKWKTDKKTESCMEHTWKEDAIFNTLKEAQEHVYGRETVNGENVVSRKIVDYGRSS